MTDFAPFIVALLVGLSSALLVYTGMRMAVERGFTDHRAAKIQPWTTRLVPILDLVPVPISVKRAWQSNRAATRLLHAGLDWKSEHFAALRWLLIWVFFILGLLIALTRNWDLLGVFILVVFSAGAFYYPELWIARRIDARKLEVDLALPDFMDRLALGLEAGLGFEIALRRTARNFPGLLGAELRFVVRQLDRGHSRMAVLERMLERIPSTDLSAFVAAVKQTDRLGTSLARTLQVQKALMRARRRRRAEEASRRLPILIVFPLVFFFLPALLIIYLAPPLLHLFLGQ